jgi:5-methylthioadenosine/S-adenosylhomocysteine deaminase
MTAERAIRDVILWDAECAEAERGDIVVDEDGAIASILPARSAGGETLFDGRGSTVAIPGLVNAHTHVSMTLLRGLAEELPLMEWLTTKIFPIEDRLGPEHIRSGAELAMLEMIAGGVTCFADMYYFMDEVADAVLASGMRAALCRGLPGDNDEKLRENVELADRYNGRDGRIVVQLGPHAPYTVPMSALEKIARTAHEKNLGIHFHWLETESERNSFRYEYKLRPIDYLEKSGLLDARELILAHSVWFPEDELEQASRPNVTIVHNPKSNLKLGSGYAPIREMLAAGLNIALGTDGASSNNRLDMWDEMRVASLMHKGFHRDPTLVSARDVMRMATVSGARGIGFKNTGVIRPGYQADLALIDIDKPHYVGMDETNVPEFLVYAGSSHDVRATIVAGKILYEDGKYATLDRDAIMAKAREHREWIDRG